MLIAIGYKAIIKKSVWSLSFREGMTRKRVPGDDTIVIGKSDLRESPESISGNPQVAVVDLNGTFKPSE